MKSLLRVIILHCAAVALIYGQSRSINNTLGSGGTFTVKDGSTTFLSLSQSDGYLSLNKSLTLPVTTGSARSGIQRDR